MHQSSNSLAIRLVHKFLYSNLSVLLVAISVLAGAAALWLTPREEEPQIVVPLADVIVQCPGRSAAEVEHHVTTRLEKLLYQIDGVEYVYSKSRPGLAIVTVRFYVGQNREQSFVKLHDKIQANHDIVPASVASWVIKPIEIDDVPIVTLALTGGGGDEASLRRVAEELVDRLQAVPNTGITSIVGGRPREISVSLHPEALAAYSVPVSQVAASIRAAGSALRAGNFTNANQIVIVESGELFRNAQELAATVIATHGGRPVYLRDLADVKDGPAEVKSFVRFGKGPAWGTTHAEGFDMAAGTPLGEVSHSSLDKMRLDEPANPSVTIAIAKRKGTNAVWVARDLLKSVESLRESVVPADMQLIVTRNMGVTANHKVNELLEALWVAVLIVIALLAMALGWREAFIVAVAVPIVFALTLAVNLMFGYTINRVTLFALILALGLLVDDPIVDVENIHRHFHIRKKATREIVMEAVNEVRPPLITATLAVILSFLPMFFITGMMGPYMAPMALNVPVTMIMSMVVAFTITPWLTYHVLKGGVKARGTAGHEPSPDDIKRSITYRIFHPLMAPMLHRRWIAWSFLAAVGLLAVGAAAMPMFRMVPLKMLPFDNKNELQLVLDTPRSTAMESSAAVVREFERYLQTVPEVVAFESYAGVPSPMDFNGLVRQYYLRGEPHHAELRLILADKKLRSQQSHALALRLRDDLTAIAAKHNATLRIVESPPGPPVIATIVAEVFGQPDQSNDDLRAAAAMVKARFAREPGVGDIDSTIEAPQRLARFVIDQEKAAINGISPTEINDTLAVALGGKIVADAAAPQDRNELSITLRLTEADRSSLRDLERLYVQSGGGTPVSLSELGKWVWDVNEQTIYHKNLRPVQYVFAEAAGRAPADIILDIQADKDSKAIDSVPPVSDRTFLHNGGGVPWSVSHGIDVVFSGEGEWLITLDVFRDLGLAFAAALVAIYVLLVNETGSFILPVIIMLAIPLTIIGIMPGFWLLNQIGLREAGGYADPVFFTATAMIGMIALAGIVTRDAIILVDFIHHSLARGRSLFDAIMESRVVRLRPILLTAAAATLGAWPITLDPIFSGLAWSLIFGLISSTAFTLFVIPVSYWLIYHNKPGHGLPRTDTDHPVVTSEPEPVKVR